MQFSCIGGLINLEYNESHFTDRFIVFESGYESITKYLLVSPAENSKFNVKAVDTYIINKMTDDNNRIIVIFFVDLIK